MWADDQPLAQLTLQTAITGKGKSRTTSPQTVLTYLHPDHLNTPRLATDRQQSG